METLDYLDNLQERKRFTEQGDAVVFESEVSKNRDIEINTNVADHLILEISLFTGRQNLSEHTSKTGNFGP